MYVRLWKASVAFIIVFALIGSFAAAQEEQDYVTGGQLAGVELPLFPTQHGEPPGYPGCIPGEDYSPQGQAPQLQLYPDSVEHYRAYFSHYLPVRALFDRQSQVANWNAPDIVGAENTERFEEPVYWMPLRSDAVDTGRKRAPVPVARCRPGDPVMTLDLGELDPGLYVVRVIGAVEAEDVEKFRKSLFLAATVNDGPNGEMRTYRRRAGYCEEFYDVADFYFHALETRNYQVQIWVDEGSEVDLLVHNISLDDVLAGTERRAVKTRSIYPARDGVTPTAPTITGDARLARDAEIWEGFIPSNVHSGSIPSEGYGQIPQVGLGTDEMTAAETNEQHGAWNHAGIPSRILLRNNKLNLEYTIDDLINNRPLPDPYPFKDDGTGLTFPGEAPGSGRAWAPVPAAVNSRITSYMNAFLNGSDNWRNTGNADVAHDSAIYMIRWALEFPTMDDADAISALVRDQGSFNRGYRVRRRTTTSGQAIGHFGFQFRLARAYDQLFDFIKDNQEIADSVGRYLPGVETPDDVIELLDVYLVQTLAKRFLRYNYYGDGRQPAMLSEIAAVMNDTSVTDPWMEWLFSRTFYYPRPLAGLPDYLVAATGRDGRSTIGSSSYVMGDYSAAEMAEKLELYIENDGNPDYDLRDPDKYPKTRTALYFPTSTRTAGLFPMRMGNVSGPDKNMAHGFNHLLSGDTDTGWRWTRDPDFAFIIYHYGNRDEWSKEEWQEIEEAAQQVERPIWMENRSRILPNYAAFLETGLEHDDFRFRRSAMLRIGAGTGHAHHDTLDLQIHAHGIPMTVDAGQRPGYSSPGDRLTRVHNTVEVNNQNWSGDHNVSGANSWIRVMADNQGAHYMDAQISPNPQARYARRQVALINVDEGEGSQPLGPEQWGPNVRNMPQDIVTPNSYVFDVFRVAGGNIHTYCFHSNTSEPDGPYQPVTNALDIRDIDEVPPEDELGRIAHEYLNRGFRGHRYFGVAPENLTVVFTTQKEEANPEGRVQHAGTERRYLVNAYDPDAPDKHLKLHMSGVEGALIMKGDLYCQQWIYSIPNIYVQKRGEDLQTAFAAILEPYAGEPFIESVISLPIDGDDADDSLGPVAIEVITTNGHRDINYASGRPHLETDVEGEVIAAGEHAFYSTDDQGLRQASLNSGTRLTTPDIDIRVPEAKRVASIVEVDHAQRKVWIDQPWTHAEGNQLVEIKTQPFEDERAWQTGFMTTSITPDNGRSEIKFLRSAELFRSQIRSVNEEEGVINTALPVPVNASGFRRGWTATNDAGDREWRVANAGGTSFTLKGQPVSEESFQPDNVLRLWEYGVGDEIRLASTVNIRRLPEMENGRAVYELTANTPLTVSFANGEVNEITEDALAENGGTIRLLGPAR